MKVERFERIPSHFTLDYRAFIVEYDLPAETTSNIRMMMGESGSRARALRNAFMYAFRKSKSKKILESTWMVPSEGLGIFEKELGRIEERFKNEGLVSTVWIHPMLMDENGYVYLKLDKLVRP